MNIVIENLQNDKEKLDRNVSNRRDVVQGMSQSIMLRLVCLS